MKKIVLFLLFISAIIVSCATKPANARKGPEMYRDLKVFSDRTPAAISQDHDGIAVKGYDMVALFGKGRAVVGLSEFSTIYLGASWFFENPENRDVFVRDPESFMPEYGGYCSWSVANDSELPPSPGDPRAFDVVNGKMYFKYNKFVRMLWRMSKSAYIAKADVRWPMFKDSMSSFLAR